MFPNSPSVSAVLLQTHSVRLPTEARGKVREWAGGLGCTGPDEEDWAIRKRDEVLGEIGWMSKKEKTWSFINSEQVIFKNNNYWKIKWMIIYVIKERNRRGIHMWENLVTYRLNGFWFLILLLVSNSGQYDFMSLFLICSLYLQLLWNAENDIKASWEI